MKITHKATKIMASNGSLYSIKPNNQIDRNQNRQQQLFERIKSEIHKAIDMSDLKGHDVEIIDYSPELSYNKSRPDKIDVTINVPDVAYDSNLHFVAYLNELKLSQSEFINTLASHLDGALNHGVHIFNDEKSDIIEYWRKLSYELDEFVDTMNSNDDAFIYYDNKSLDHLINEDFSNIYSMTSVQISITVTIPDLDNEKYVINIDVNYDDDIDGIIDNLYNQVDTKIDNLNDIKNKYDEIPQLESELNSTLQQVESDLMNKFIDIEIDDIKVLVSKSLGYQSEAPFRIDLICKFIVHAYDDQVEFEMRYNSEEWGNTSIDEIEKKITRAINYRVRKYNIK